MYWIVPTIDPCSVKVSDSVSPVSEFARLLASPKSSTLTYPSLVTTTLALLRSR